MANNEPEERWTCQELLKCNIFETFKVCNENDYYVESFIASHSFGSLFLMNYLKTNER